MPPPGCPIPDWVYPGRVLRSRHNPERHIWIDSIRYSESGDFYVALRSVLSTDPLVVNRFCVTEAWAIGFRTVYEPTGQWEPHPRFEWDEELRSQFLDDDQTCEIALRDGSRTWNIESMGVEGSRMTMGVSREVIDEEVPDGEMEAVGEPYRREHLPHLMAPPAIPVPLNDPMSEEDQADLNALLNQAEVDPDMRVFTTSPLQGFRRVQPGDFQQGQPVSVVGGNFIGTVVETTPTGVAVRLHDGGSIVEFERDALQPYQDRPTPPEFSIGQLVSLFGGGGLVGTVVAVTPSGVQVHTHDGASSVIEFERGALEVYQGEPGTVSVGDIIRGPDGTIIGHVRHVSGDAVTWVAGNNQSYVSSIVISCDQGTTFEKPNRWVGPDPRIRRSNPPQPEKPRLTSFERILKDDEDD